MKLFLKLKHWQLFLVMTAIPLLFQIKIYDSINSINDTSELLLYFVLMMVFFMFFLFVWLYTLAVNLYKILPENISMSITKFKIIFTIPVIYYILFFAYLLILDNYQPLVMNYFVPIMIFLLLGSIVALIGTLYSLYFIAKALISIELKKELTFSDFAGEFFLLWFFPIGVWIIQPRINKLFANNSDTMQNEKF